MEDEANFRAPIAGTVPTGSVDGFRGSQLNGFESPTLYEVVNAASLASVSLFFGDPGGLFEFDGTHTGYQFQDSPNGRLINIRNGMFWPVPKSGRIKISAPGGVTGNIELYAWSYEMGLIRAMSGKK